VGLAFDTGDSSGNLYVSNVGNNTIRKFSLTGTDLGTFASTGLNQPQGLAVDLLGYLYASNIGNNSIRKFSLDGRDLGTFASSGLSQPNGLAFADDTFLYVANTGDRTVRRFFAVPFFVPGIDLGTFARTSAGQPVGLAFDPFGNLYVTSVDSSGIQKFDAFGRDLGASAFSDVTHPFGITIDRANGKIYVSTLGDNTVHELSPSGRSDEGSFGSSVLSAPTGIAIHSIPPPTVAVTRSSLLRKGRSNSLFQMVTLQNISGGKIPGPVSLVLDSLQNATLSNQTGVTANYSPSGSPFIRVNLLGADNVFDPQESASIELKFANVPANADIPYSTRVLAPSSP
jgi:DNA-binding beta-propeller fold protein YncE